MNPVMRPVGPEDPSVYWRRRLAALAVLVALVLVVFLVVRWVAGGSDDAAAATSKSGAAAAAEPSPAATTGAGQDDDQKAGADDGGSGESTATASPAASATTAPPPGEPTRCEAGKVQLTATADASTYASGATPTLGVLIRNTGSDACTLDAGSAAVELTVVSGSDRIWSSDDCQKEPSSKMQTLQPGAELASTVVWPVQRSAEGCPADLAAPRPGTYQLTGRVGDLTSQPVAFTLG